MLGENGPEEKGMAMLDAKSLQVRGFLSSKLDCVCLVALLKDYTYRDLERVEFWEQPRAEEMRNRTIEEAVGDLAEFEYHQSFLTLHGYARMEISLAAGSSLERILEWLDEEFGDPYGNDSTEPTKEMLEAEERLHEAIRRGYRSWTCESVVMVQINLDEWRKNDGRPVEEP